MRNCQLCGAKSWGPVKDTSALEDTLMAGHAGVDPNAHLLECDCCGCFAREDLIADLPAGPHFAGQPLMMADLFPGVHALALPSAPALDYAAEASKALRGLVQEKAPETRTERLVVALLGSDKVMSETMIDTVVQRARQIEAQLDHGLLPGPGTPAPAASRPRNFASDFLQPAQKWATALGASSRVTQEMLPLVLDTAICFGALEALTGNESLSDVAKLDAAYGEKMDRLSVWGRT